MSGKITDGKLKALLVAATVALICLLLVLGLYITGIVSPAADREFDESAVPESLDHDGYKLEQVVILSRHNIRSPMSEGNSLLAEITPHEWFEWTSPGSELSLRGGALETCMGQYFRKWLEAEGLFTENYRPDEEAVRIYANSMQRTVATARFFTAGLLPSADEEVEYHVEFNTMDPVFTPQLTFVSDDYNAAAIKQIDEMFSGEIRELKDNFELISDVIDIEDSEARKNGTVGPLRTDDLKVVLENYKEPMSVGSFKTACVVSDALTLQYYEEPDPVKAAFGKALSESQWIEIGDIKEAYTDTLFTAPLISYNVANPLLKEIYSEMNAEGREFTFLCGHDSNVASVLSALGVEEYALPETIERKTPIGVKLVFSRWKSDSGESFWDVDLVYQTTDQLKNVDILTEDYHPASVDIGFKGISQNKDSMFTDDDLKERLESAIAEYDKIVSEY